MHDAGAWLSLHLFYHQVEAHDRLLVEAVAPAVQTLQGEGWIERFFFLRYGQGGPHVRLRMRGSREGWREVAREEVRRRFSAFVAEHPCPVTLEREAFYRGSPSALPSGEDGRTWYENQSVQELAYEPEYERYGGREAMGLSEDLFHVSSTCALGVLPTLLQAPGKRTGLALELTFLGAQPIAPLSRTLGSSLAHYARFLGLMLGQSEALKHEARVMFEKHGAQLGARLSSLSRDFREGRLTGLHRRWTEAVRETATALEALERDGRLQVARVREAGMSPEGQESSPALSAIGMSHLHMLNNRLGVTLRTEAVLAYLIQHLLEQGRMDA
jgi:thiopeptide-type bacteriocin biosynthesis protein